MPSGHPQLRPMSEDQNLSCAVYRLEACERIHIEPDLSVCPQALDVIQPAAAVITTPIARATNH
jgi:hypothetical protein